MRIEYDHEADAVYVDVTDATQAHTVEVEPDSIYVDIDAEGRTLGIEFLNLDTFRQYIEEHGGLDIPEKFTGPQSLVPA